MFRKVAIAGATAAVIIGAGTAALATTGSSGTPGTPSTSGTSSSSSSSSSSATKGAGLGRFARRHPEIAALIKHHAVHGQIVTDDNGTDVTHDGIVGTVSAVSPSSITVKASDGFTQTFSINSSTKVRVRTDGKSSTISDVRTGVKVGVVGTGTSAPVATYILAEA